MLPLVLTFRKSLETTVVPKQWKEANVTAIYKEKGHRWDPSNYRPVNLTSQVCKIFERIIRDSMVKHLETNKLTDYSQHGFRNHKSCLTNLLEFLEKVTDYVDKGIPVDVIYLDFKVPHKRSMEKVRALGNTGKLAGWLEEWLSDNNNNNNNNTRISINVT